MNATPTAPAAAHLFILCRVMPLFSAGSSITHLWLAGSASGLMRAVMIAGALACLLCAVHPFLPGASPVLAGRMVIVMSATSLLAHMGLITLHAAGHGQHHHESGRALEAVPATDHMQLMLLLVALELVIMLTSAAALRRLRVAGDPGRATVGDSARRAALQGPGRPSRVERPPGAPVPVGTCAPDRPAAG